MSRPVISIILGSYNRYTFLKLAIKSIRKELLQLPVPAEIIVVDGGSSDATIPWLTKQKDIVSIIQHNHGSWKNKPIKRCSWGYFMNLGFKCAQGKYICMVSDDCLIIPNAIKNGFVSFEEKLKNNEKVGALAFFYRNIPFHYKDWTKPGTYFVNKVFDTLYVNHGLYLKKALVEANYIDEENFLFYCADVDLCFKLQKLGYACLPASNSYIEHYPHANLITRKQNETPSYNDFIALQKKWNDSSCEWDPHNAFTEKTAFSNISKQYFDSSHTVQQFTRAHFTNIEFWTVLLKDIVKRKRIKWFQQ